MTGRETLPGSAAVATARPRVVAMLACFNRKPLTLRALRAVAAAGDVFDLSVVLFDDGSSDGTADAVRAEFPDAVILHGTGDAYWNGGMHRAWMRALKLRADAYLWLNDDVELDGDAFARLAETWRAAAADRTDGALVLVGATRNPSGTLSYGGLVSDRSPFALRFRRLPIVEALRPIDTFNGNIVLVTAAAVERVGIIDPGFFHKFGDIDYGLRAKKAGVPVLLLPGTLGVCVGQEHPDLGKFGLVARWRFVRSHRGTPFASWWRMTRKHSGVWMVPHFLLAYRTLLYPTALLRATRRAC